MKKFLNTADTYLTDALAGFAAAHPELSANLESAVVTRTRGAVPGKVGLVSGGGSGHEPLHTGFVGEGMLDAACPGEIFTSPVPDQVTEAVRAVDSGEGTVLVVKNYTGDVMNFEMAAELLGEEGLRVETVLVNDDVAVEDSTFTAGRRGTGATLLVEKIAGASAARGDSLSEVAEVGRRVNAAS
ncbi:dihydroxyacetone kinase subunit DhaK, partial [Streptomonospora algeriensis]